MDAQSLDPIVEEACRRYLAGEISTAELQGTIPPAEQEPQPGSERPWTLADEDRVRDELRRLVPGGRMVRQVGSMTHVIQVVDLYSAGEDGKDSEHDEC